MTREEAVELLTIYREDEGLESDSSMLVAIEMAQKDPSIQIDVDAGKQFDAEFKSALKSVSPPADIKDRILSENNEEAVLQFPKEKEPRAWFHFTGFSIAAALIILLALNFTFWNSPVDQPLDASVVEVILKSEQTLATIGPRMVSNDLSQLAGFLRSNGKEVPQHIPKNLREYDKIACDVFSINGVKVGLMCFKKDEDVYHLFSFNCDELPQGMSIEKYSYGRYGERNCATWRVDNTVYFIMSKCEPKKIKDVLEI